MYKPLNNNTWIGRIDKNEGELGLRWHQLVRLVDLNKEELPILQEGEKGIAFIGFCCDEGVHRNKGRTGAKEGPEALRLACSNLADHFPDNTIIIDIGDVICVDQKLEKAQAELQQVIADVRAKGYTEFVFGGGHEVAYPHYMGIRQSISTDKVIGIINIDAHFDLRLPEGQTSSGTPFYQIAEDCKNTNQQFKYFVFGIQNSANTRALFQRAEDLSTEYILANELFEENQTMHQLKLKTFIKSVDVVYLTICLDVFDAAVAPGVSAPSAIGLQPQSVLPFISQITSSNKLTGADIAELNPSLDRDSRTARLAAKLVFEILS